MRRSLALAFLVLPTLAAAQTQTPGTTVTGPATPSTPPVNGPAPVPAITPPGPQTGAPGAVPEVVSPPGVGNNRAGPADSTPFSSTPTDAMPRIPGSPPDVSR